MSSLATSSLAMNTASGNTTDRTAFPTGMQNSDINNMRDRIVYKRGILRGTWSHLWKDDVEMDTIFDQTDNVQYTNVTLPKHGPKARDTMQHLGGQVIGNRNAGEKKMTGYNAGGQCKIINGHPVGFYWTDKYGNLNTNLNTCGLWPFNDKERKGDPFPQKVDAESDGHLLGVNFHEITNKWGLTEYPPNTAEANQWERTNCWLCGLPLSFCGSRQNDSVPECEHKIALVNMILFGAGSSTQVVLKPPDLSEYAESVAFLSDFGILTKAGDDEKALSTARFEQDYIDWKYATRGEQYAWSHKGCNRIKMQCSFIKLRITRCSVNGTIDEEGDKIRFEYYIENKNIKSFVYYLFKNGIKKGGSMDDDCYSVLVKLLKAWNGHKKPTDTKNPKSNIFHRNWHLPYEDGLLKRINEKKWGPKYVFRTIYRQCDTIIKALNSRPKLIPLHLLINRQRVQDINLLTGVGIIDGNLYTFYDNVKELFFVSPPAPGEEFPGYVSGMEVTFDAINNFLRSIFNLQLNLKAQNDTIKERGPIAGVAVPTVGGMKKGDSKSSLKSDTGMVVEGDKKDEDLFDDEEERQDAKKLEYLLDEMVELELGGDAAWSGNRFMITDDTLKDINGVNGENYIKIQDIKAGEIEDLKNVDDKLQGIAGDYTDYTTEQIESKGKSIAASNNSSTIDGYLRAIAAVQPPTAVGGEDVIMSDEEEHQSPTSNNLYTDLTDQVWSVLGQQFRDYLANNFKEGQTETLSQGETMEKVEEITPLAILRDDLFQRVPRNGSSGYVNNASDRKLYRILARQNKMAGEESYGSEENRPREAKLPTHVLRRDQWAHLRGRFSIGAPIEDRLIEFGMTNKEPELINQMSDYIKENFESVVSDEDIIRYILDPPELKKGYNARQNVISLSRDFRDFLEEKDRKDIIDAVKNGKRREIPDTIDVLYARKLGKVGAQGNLGPKSLGYGNSSGMTSEEKMKKEANDALSEEFVRGPTEHLDPLTGRFFTPALTDEQMLMNVKLARKEEEANVKAAGTCPICDKITKKHRRQASHITCYHCRHQFPNIWKGGKKKKRKKRTRRRRKRKKKRTKRKRRRKKSTKKKRRNIKKRTRRMR